MYNGAVYQALSGDPGSSLTPKLPHLTDWEALFLGGLVRMPRASRPHGIITWAAAAFRLSRTSIYALGERLEAKLFEAPSTLLEQEAQSGPGRAEPLRQGTLIEVTPARLKRPSLRATFPGNVSIRPTQAVLCEALDQRPSVGYISQLRVEAGLRARQFLRSVDYSGLGRVIVGRDETSCHGLPILMVIEPVSAALLLAAWTEQDDVLAALAARLMALFDQAAHTNSLTEAINGLLKSFLHARQSFQSTQTLQAYLDLFVLWHNTRIFERGKRQGFSPFQLAGVETASEDWVTLFGY